MRENFKLKNKKERVNKKKESVEGDPGGKKEEEGEEEKEKRKSRKTEKKSKKKRRTERKKRKNLVRQRQYGKFLHNREGRAHIFTHVQAHTHGKYTCYPIHYHCIVRI